MDKVDDWYINNLLKNQVSAVFHSRVICRSVSPKLIEGHKHGLLKVTETSLLLSFAIETKDYCSRDPTH